MQTHTLRSFISDHLGLTIPSNDHLPFSVREKSFKAGSVITRYGQIEDTIYFLMSGLIEVSVKSARNEERIVEFIAPGGFFSSYASFRENIPSEIELRALMDCKVEYSPQLEVKKAFSESLLTNQLARVIIETLYLRRMKREIDFLTKTAEERYQELVEMRSEIIQNVSVKKMAQYLGIHPESLSRIRKSISEKKPVS